MSLPLEFKLLDLTSFDDVKYMGKWYQAGYYKEWFEPKTSNVALILSKDSKDSKNSNKEIKVLVDLDVLGNHQQLLGSVDIIQQPLSFTVKLPKVILGFDLTGTFNIRDVVVDEKGNYIFVLITRKGSSSLNIIARSKTIPIILFDWVKVRVESMGYNWSKVQLA